MPNEDPNYIDLYDLGLDTPPSYDWRDGSMHKQEELIKGELIDKNYRSVGVWRDGERDSFGPLSRVLPVTTPEGAKKTLVYG